MKKIDLQFPYPRRRLIRSLLRRLSHVAFAVLTDLQIIGQENLPKEGPLLVVANHFSFIDPVAMVRATPWPLEFVGGFQMPNAPASVTWIPKAQGGVLGIFPEAGSWATVLRPPRPGAAFLAVRTGARILPMGFDGLPDVFPRLRRGRRARVTVQIGRPFGPFHATGRGQARRQQLDAIGHEIMRHIAELIIRAAAQGTEIYPWADAPEG
jgi:1-acyl-sn-glycerol-3-phosphate acyltransferase